MPITQDMLAAGRVGLKKYYAVEMAKQPAEWQQLIGRVESTRQTFEVYKQYAGYGAATLTPEGASVDFEDPAPIYLLSLRPVLYTKGAQWSVQAQYTDQYGLFSKMTPQIAASFVKRRNVTVADLHNTGFTSTSYGVNSETLYSVNHSMGGINFANTSMTIGSVPGPSATALNLGMSPLAIEWMWQDLQNQVDAKGFPLFPSSKIKLMVPPKLFIPTKRAVDAVKLAGTNNNDPNVVGEYIADVFMGHYLTSQTAWFARASNDAEHGLVFLEQLAYDFMDFPMMPDLMRKCGAYESYALGWYDAHGTWGNAGV